MFNVIRSKMKEALDAHVNTYSMLREAGANRRMAIYAAFGPHTWTSEVVVVKPEAITHLRSLAARHHAEMEAALQRFIK